MQLTLFPTTDVALPPRQPRPPRGAIVPKTNRIKIPFEWVSLGYLLSIPTIDFDETGLGTEENCDDKRNDPGYDELVMSIDQDGIKDPVFMGPCDRAYFDTDAVHQLGNGHHRVVACLDLGYTHMPYTDDADYEWRTSGITTLGARTHASDDYYGSEESECDDGHGSCKCGCGL